MTVARERIMARRAVCIALLLAFCPPLASTARCKSGAPVRSTTLTSTTTTTPITATTTTTTTTTATTTTETKKKQIKIGFLNDATGPISVYAGAFTFASTTAAATLNDEHDDYVFEVVELDSACDVQAAAEAAHTLVDAGVVAVAGAACSGASMGANAVLAAAGIPMVSYASSSPALSDATAYPDFFRIVPSSGMEGDAMAHMVKASGVTSPALLYMTNAYGENLAEKFEYYWLDMGMQLCLKSGYAETATDSLLIQLGLAVSEAACDSAVLVSYSADGAMIIETMASTGAKIPVFGGDGIAGKGALLDYTNPANADGVQVTMPRNPSSSSGDFATTCKADNVCASGIYTAEAYDAVMMIGKAAMHEGGEKMALHLKMVGMDYSGASGVHNFMDNGDISGSGYDVCTFNHVPTYGDYFNCNMVWTATSGLSAAEFTGLTTKIGFLNDATGPISVYAAGFVTASQIALVLANTIGWNKMLQFEIVYADSACNVQTAAEAAQKLLDAGVVGVVGAACSGASMGANAVLATAGIPMVSYASTGPALSDATAYPDFFRVVLSDALQGEALSAVVQADMPAERSVGLLHMTDQYGAILAEFTADFTAAGNVLCTTIGYDQSTSDFSAAVESLVENNCTSAVLLSYARDGGMILDEMALQNWTGQVYGGDGMAMAGLGTDASSTVDGIIATTPEGTPLSGSTGTVGYVFRGLCTQQVACASGIYTAEAFDATFVMALAVISRITLASTTLSHNIMAIGQELEGASGPISFLPNGDIPGAGYCVGHFTEDIDGNVAFTCNRSWDKLNGLKNLID